MSQQLFYGLEQLKALEPNPLINNSFNLGYTVCYFTAQVWKVDPQISKSPNPNADFIWEFKRESLDGRSAFEKLLSGVAS